MEDGDGGDDALATKIKQMGKEELDQKFQQFIVGAFGDILGGFLGIFLVVFGIFLVHSWDFVGVSFKEIYEENWIFLWGKGE